MRRSTAGVSRRRLITAAGQFAALASLGTFARTGSAAEKETLSRDDARAQRVYRARIRAAQMNRDLPSVEHISNGDEQCYPKRWGNFSKGLPHDAFGQVDPAAYNTYLRAIATGDPDTFERIPLGGYLKLADPQAAFSIDLVGPDSAKLSMPPAPALASAEQAGELVELYWMAVLRDVAFNDYESHPFALQAAKELSAMSDFRGLKENGAVTARTLFRGVTAGSRRGPYVSQFLLRDIPMSPLMIPQKIRTGTGGREAMTDVASWLNIQNGQLAQPMTFDSQPRYIRNGRDLAEYVHRDFTYQAALCACMMLLKISAPLDGGIPYQYSITQGGFVTFGPSDIFHLVATVANLALKPAWYQKWIVHRRARPEEIAGRLHFHKTRQVEVPFHRQLTDASVLELIRSQHGTYLLPQAYPEAAPSHPSYPAGHAVLAAASATVLKACFNESWELPGCVVPSSDGTVLEPYRGPALTLGGELDKLVENIANARNIAGIHWRSDAGEGMKLGEDFAIHFLREMKLTSSEFFTGFSVTKFDGTRVTI